MSAAVPDFRVDGRHFQPAPPAVERNVGRASPRPHQPRTNNNLQQPSANIVHVPLVRAAGAVQVNLTDHLSRVVGLPVEVAETYAADLVAEGCDSVRSFDELSPSELREDFGWKKFHVKKFEAYTKFFSPQALSARGTIGSESPGFVGEVAPAGAGEGLHQSQPPVDRALYRGEPEHDPVAALHADPRVAPQVPAGSVAQPSEATDTGQELGGRPLYRPEVGQGPETDQGTLSAAEARREAMVRRLQKQAQDDAVASGAAPTSLTYEMHGLDTSKDKPLGTRKASRDYDEDSLLGFELRVDETDGNAYPYESFAAMYGTARAPDIWKAAVVSVAYNPDDFQISLPAESDLGRRLEDAEASTGQLPQTDHVQQFTFAELLQGRQERKRQQIVEGADRREANHLSLRGVYNITHTFENGCWRAQLAVFSCHWALRVRCARRARQRSELGTLENIVLKVARLTVRGRVVEHSRAYEREF